MPFEEETARFLDAWMKVRQMVQASNFNRFRRAGLSATQFMALNVIPEDGMTLSALARRLSLSPATLNSTVNSLEERGFVLRQRDPRDARKIIIRATREGAEMQNAASGEFHGFIAGLFARMSKTRREGLLAGLEAMSELHETDQVASATPRDADALPERRSTARSPRR